MTIPKAGPGYMHLPEWAADEYLEQLTGEKKITVRDLRTHTRKPLYVKTYVRNEALELTVYCQAGLFILQHFIEPATHRNLGRPAALVQQGHAPGSLIPPRVRRVRSPGLG